MPDLSTLVARLKDYGYSCNLESVDADLLFVRISSGELKEVTAALRANQELCNVGIMLGLLQAVGERQRYGLAMALLELNFEHPLARVGLFRARAEEKDKPALGILVAESSFFWPDLTNERFDQRMKGLRAIAERASNHLAARDALSNTNPFYSHLMTTRSPVRREDFTNF